MLSDSSSSHSPSPWAPPVALRGGLTIPAVGFGVFRTGPGDDTRRVVREALACGYRHIDTARVYGNEADVAEGPAATSR